MQNKYKSPQSIIMLFFVAVFLPAVSLNALAGTPSENKTGNTFQLTIQSDTDTFVLSGRSDFMATPSSYSINLIEDEGRCVIHMLNFRTPPGPGTYEVEKTEEVRTAIVCILDNADPRERMVSKSGTFTITHLTNRHLTGHFDMIMKGPLSEKEFRLTGEVTSENTPTNLRFDPN